MPSRAERYLDHLDSLAGDLEPDFYQLDSTKDGLKGMTAVVYRGLPEPGHLIGLTYGLSLAEHPDWQQTKPELCICVQSDDVAWALAVAHLAEGLRGDCPFDYGSTIDFGQPISDESEMSSFVIFAPVVLERDDYLNIRVGGRAENNGHAHPDDIVDIAGCYPIHDVELAYIQEHGLEAFWELDWDPYDVKRPPAV
jgi:Suppressor of fused protein (SUFU)